MKKYTNIPIKERIRNADRCYRHEVMLENREIKALIKAKNQQMKSECKTDKEREAEEANALFKALNESEDTK